MTQGIYRRVVDAYHADVAVHVEADRFGELAHEPHCTQSLCAGFNWSLAAATRPGRQFMVELMDHLRRYTSGSSHTGDPYKGEIGVTG